MNPVTGNNDLAQRPPAARARGDGDTTKRRSCPLIVIINHLRSLNDVKRCACKRSEMRSRYTRQPRAGLPDDEPAGEGPARRRLQRVRRQRWVGRRHGDDRGSDTTGTGGRGEQDLVEPNLTDLNLLLPASAALLLHVRRPCADAGSCAGQLGVAPVGQPVRLRAQRRGFPVSLYGSTSLAGSRSRIGWVDVHRPRHADGPPASSPARRARHPAPPGWTSRSATRASGFRRARS